MAAATSGFHGELPGPALSSRGRRSARIEQGEVGVAAARLPCGGR